MTSICLISVPRPRSSGRTARDEGARCLGLSVCKAAWISVLLFLTLPRRSISARRL